MATMAAAGPKKCQAPFNSVEKHPLKREELDRSSEIRIDHQNKVARLEWKEIHFLHNNHYNF